MIKNRYFYGNFEKKSTVDFEGIIKGGKHVAFDCKRTALKHFPIRNLETHQYNYLKNIHKLNGISFLIIEFTELNKIIRLEFEVLEQYWSKMKYKKRGTCSIKYVDLEKYEIKNSLNNPLNFLKNYY